jgi:hypothetical protein
MAKYKIAKDGHPYLTHGYALLDESGRETARFATYQVNPGAEHLFERVGFEEGESVSQETFYALLLDGDLYNDARPTGIEIASIPNSIMSRVEVLPKIPPVLSVAHELYLLDIFEKLLPQNKDPRQTLAIASWVCIRRHYERHLLKSSKMGRRS